MLQYDTIKWLYDMVLNERLRYKVVKGVIYYSHFISSTSLIESFISSEIEPYIVERS